MNVLVKISFDVYLQDMDVGSTDEMLAKEALRTFWDDPVWHKGDETIEVITRRVP